MRDQYLDIGKVGELHVLGELLKRGVVPYEPLVDRAGFDAVIPHEDGSYIAVQIKTCTSTVSSRWFAIDRLEPCPNLYVVCVAMNLQPFETWIIPSELFAANATRSKSGHLDLDLNAKPRGQSRTRAEKLKEFLEAWHLLTGDDFARIAESSFAEDWLSEQDAIYNEEQLSHG